jgi:anti-sigma factor (TIGR02949 family)
MTSQSSDTEGCRRFLDHVYHYQADELPAGERAGFENHLDACPDCAKRFEIEDAFLRVLKSRVKRVAPPPDLLPRMQAMLQPPTLTLPWLRPAWSGPWLTAAAASGLVGFVLWFGVGRLAPTATPPAAVRAVAGDVVVVDYDCDRLGRTLGQQRVCDDRRHVNALRLVDGSYWNIGLVDDASRQLALDPEMRGRRMHVSGELHERSRTVHLDEARDLGAASDSAGDAPQARFVPSAG